MISSNIRPNILVSIILNNTHIKKSCLSPAARQQVTMLSYHRSFNSILGKIGRIASEDVVLELTCQQANLTGAIVCP
jgi:hypothetical protein